MHIKKIHVAAANSKWPWYETTAMSLRNPSMDTELTIYLDDESHEKIEAKKEGREPRETKPTFFAPVPRDQWPPFAKAIALLGDTSDRGVGDTVTRRLGTGGIIFKVTLQSLGIDCGCDSRRNEWNSKYSYAKYHMHMGGIGMGDAICGYYAACGLAVATGEKVDYHSHFSEWVGSVPHHLVRVLPHSKFGVDACPGRGYLTRITTAKSFATDYCKTLAEEFQIKSFNPRRPPEDAACRDDWCNNREVPALAVLIPAVIRESKHVEMLRVQSLISQRLRKHGIQAFTCLVVDAIEERFIEEVRSLDFDMGIFQRTPPNGVRRPTETGLRAIREVWGNVPVLRVIQDTPIIDAESLSSDILNAIGSDGDWVAGGLRTFKRFEGNPNFQALNELEIPEKEEYQHIHGCFMLAKLDVWERYYSAMPKSITHYADDDVMSQWILKKGGRLIPFSDTSWEHRHDSPEKISRKLFVSQGGDINSAAPDKRKIVLESKNDEYILLFPFSQHWEREWDKWTDLTLAIEATGMRVIALGTTDKAGAMNKMFAPTGAIYLWGQSSERVIEMVRNARIVVANDSGPAHLGGLLGARQWPSTPVRSRMTFFLIWPQACPQCFHAAPWQGGITILRRWRR